MLPDIQEASSLLRDAPRRFWRRLRRDHRPDTSAAPLIWGTPLAPMQDRCERSVSSGRRVNVFSFMRAVCTLGVAETGCGIGASCSIGLAVAPSKIIKRGGFVA